MCVLTNTGKCANYLISAEFIYCSLWVTQAGYQLIIIVFIASCYKSFRDWITKVIFSKVEHCNIIFGEQNEFVDSERQNFVTITY